MTARARIQNRITSIYQRYKLGKGSMINAGDISYNFKSDICKGASLPSAVTVKMLDANNFRLTFCLILTTLIHIIEI